MMFIDARIPIRFGVPESRASNDAVLTDGPTTLPPQAQFSVEPRLAAHAGGCTCCLPRSTAAQALAGLFRERALAPGPAFTGVLATVSPAGEAAVRDAVAGDPLVAGRYSLVD